MSISDLTSAAVNYKPSAEDRRRVRPSSVQLGQAPEVPPDSAKPATPSAAIIVTPESSPSPAPSSSTSTPTPDATPPPPPPRSRSPPLGNLENGKKPESPHHSPRTSKHHSTPVAMTPLVVPAGDIQAAGSLSPPTSPPGSPLTSPRSGSDASKPRRKGGRLAELAYHGAELAQAGIQQIPEKFPNATAAATEVLARLRGGIKDRDVLRHFKIFSGRSKKTATLTKEQLRSALIEFHRGLGYLDDYVKLNQRGFEKIMKKHDKNTGYHVQATFMSERVEKLECCSQTLVEDLLNEVEFIFSAAFSNSSQSLPDEIRKISTLDPVQKSGKTEFRLGIYTGLVFAMVLILGFLTGSYWSTDHVGPPPRVDETIVVFRAVGLPVLLVWLWGLDMLVWEQSRVNYVFIFGFDPHTHNGASHMLENAARMTLLWVLFIFIYFNSLFPIQGLEFLSALQPYHWPLILIFIYIGIMALNSYYNRGWLLRVLGNVFTAPFHQLTFKDFFVAEQLLSLAIMFGDFFFVTCFYLHDAWFPVSPIQPSNPSDVCFKTSKFIGPVFSAVPLVLRLFQIIRREFNPATRRHALAALGEPVSALGVVFFSYMSVIFPNAEAFTVIWASLAVISSFFAIYYDLIIDWGLFSPGLTGHSRFLRDRLLYPNYLIYWWGIISNILLRFLWTLTISPDFLYAKRHPTLYASILACIEVYRRGQWNVYRLENEQLNNVGKYRATNYVPLPPPPKASLLSSASMAAIPLPPPAASATGGSSTPAATHTDSRHNLKQSASRKALLGPETSTEAGSLTAPTVAVVLPPNLAISADGKASIRHKRNRVRESLMSDDEAE